MNFKRAKLAAPFDNFNYKKYTKIPTVQLHKKIFAENPEFVEFAKPYMPLRNWFTDI